MKIALADLEAIPLSGGYRSALYVSEDSRVKGSLYFGDNLQILRNREYIPSSSVDLVYLDPPFNSDQDFNVLFEERDGTLSHSQMKTFGDTWKWTKESKDACDEIIEEGPQAVSAAVGALRSFLGTSDMMAYLAMMAPRLVELQSKLKPTGSLYLHCDPSASHYLKMLLDACFGPGQFRNEIIWRRTGAHNNPRRYGPIHDVLLFYTKSDDYFFTNLTHPYMRGHVEKRYKQGEDGRLKFTSGGNILTGAGATNGDSGKVWQGFDPSAKNRHWAVPGFLASQMPDGFSELSVIEKLDALYDAGLIEIQEGNAWPTPVRYLDDIDGPTIQDIWAYQPYTEKTVYGTDKGIDADVKWLGPTDPERVPYKTQKPIGLLTRILESSCPPDGIVLDPFCGCGTTIITSQLLGRSWIGIDVTHISLSVLKDRLRTECKINPPTAIGEPTCLTEAIKLAEEDRYQFQWWVVGCLGAKKIEKKKGPDKGIDGRIKFRDEKDGPIKQIIVSVKSGQNISVRDIRELGSVVDREDAQIGAYVTLYPPTRDMKNEALESKKYKSPWGTHRKIQILTVEEMLSGKTLDAPPYYLVDPTKKKSVKRAEFDQLERQKVMFD